MMNKDQAIAYGKIIGVKYYVKNSCGGLLGGATTLEEAQRMLREFQEDYKNNPWNKDVKVFIVEA